MLFLIDECFCCYPTGSLNSEDGYDSVYDERRSRQRDGMYVIICQHYLRDICRVEYKSFHLNINQTFKKLSTCKYVK